ncbi:ABC-type cobalt transport system permease component CbiQ and related transporter-like protein [Shewanella sediminis HAW-EB3]|uniref:ABC-type cobalt transport system permease component CbiQ and related transporter-like protein n=1 Tax=Shewanella sediminis (strain HAW-EB3) TaxID=425104 RepID=A8FV31_SHESH|nr:cobalt ECF transporter T component CbiQ [Shewanella sediminis]ABV36704.1 ABC-type cobalt transport system permease component CbiQ and related transporter-like protein [Shewanella sediminis HAW-EB3]
MIETLLAPQITGEKSIPIPPKLRVVLIVCLAMATVLTSCWLTLWLFMALVVYLWRRSDLSAKQTIKRLLAMDCLILFTVALIPFSVPGEPLFSILSFTATKEGGLMAMMILLKANIVMVTVMALCEGVDALTLGKALVELGVSRRFALLMQFTVRYIGLLYLEFHRLRQSMRVRGFKARNSMHTWRSYGYLFGMLLVRSFDRADRISQAMKCRGFRGHFLSHERLPVTKREYAHFAAYLSLISLIFCTSLSSFNV